MFVPKLQSVVHLPAFRLDHRLSNWPDCWLEVGCCAGGKLIPTRLLASQRGDLTFEAVLGRLRCQRCKKPPAPVYLCAGHRRFNYGAPPDWAIELAPERRV